MHCPYKMPNCKFLIFDILVSLFATVFDFEFVEVRLVECNVLFHLSNKHKRIRFISLILFKSFKLT